MYVYVSLFIIISFYFLETFAISKANSSIWVFPKIGVYPQIIHFNRGFPGFSTINHPFLGSPVALFLVQHPFATLKGLEVNEVREEFLQSSKPDFEYCKLD